MTRELRDLIKDEDVVKGSEFMETIGLVILKNQKTLLESTYTTLADFVVPDSLKLITEDSEHALYLVTFFSKFKETFLANCLKKKFSVRELKVKEGETPLKSEAELKSMATSLHAQWSSLVRLIRSNLGECYAAYIHLKALRLFVESVLRYGLPAQYLYIFVSLPDDKQFSSFNRRLLQALESLKLPGISLVELATAMHSSKDVRSKLMDAEEQELWTVLNMSNKDFDPYVKIPLKFKN